MENLNYRVSLDLPQNESVGQSLNSRAFFSMKFAPVNPLTIRKPYSG